MPPLLTLRQPLSAEDVLRKYMTEVVGKKQREVANLRSTGLRNEPSKQVYFDPMPSKVRVRDVARELGSLGKRGVNFLIESERDFGQTLGDALATMSKDVKEAQKAQESLDNMNVKVAKTIIAAKKQGKDTSRLEEFYKKNTGRVFDIGEIIPSTKKSAKQIFGEGIRVATDIAAFGTYGQAAKGAKTGKLLTRSTIKANRAMMGKAGQVLRKDLTKRRFGDFAQKVNIEVTGKAGISSKAAKAVAKIKPSDVDDPIQFMRLAKKELAKFGLHKNRKLLKGLQDTAFDFRMIQQYGKPIYTKGKSSLTTGKAFLRGFKELGKEGAGLGAGVAMSEALKEGEDFIDILRQTGQGSLSGGLVAGTLGGLFDASGVMKYNRQQAIRKAAKKKLKSEVVRKLKNYNVLRLAGDKNQETYRTRGGTWFMGKGSDEKIITDMAEMIGGNKRIAGKIKMTKPLVIKNANLMDGSFAVVNEGYENFIPEKYSQLSSSLWDKAYQEGADIDLEIMNHLYESGIPEKTARDILSKTGSNKFNAAMDLIIGKGLKEAGYDGLVLESGKTKHIFNLAKKNFANLLRTK